MVSHRPSEVSAQLRDAAALLRAEELRATEYDRFDPRAHYRSCPRDRPNPKPSTLWRVKITKHPPLMRRGVPSSGSCATCKLRGRSSITSPTNLVRISRDNLGFRTRPWDKSVRSELASRIFWRSRHHAERTEGCGQARMASGPRARQHCRTSCSLYRTEGIGRARCPPRFGHSRTCRQAPDGCNPRPSPPAVRLLSRYRDIPVCGVPRTIGGSRPGDRSKTATVHRSTTAHRRPRSRHRGRDPVSLPSAYAFSAEGPASALQVRVIAVLEIVRGLHSEPRSVISAGSAAPL